MLKLFNSLTKLCKNVNVISKSKNVIRNSKCLTSYSVQNRNCFKTIISCEANFINSFNTFNQKYNRKRFFFGKDAICLILSINILKWLGFEDEDEKKESELIMTLKRAVLSTKRQEFNKAEQLLHIALRLAQQEQNEQGITYCYDLMANLAFETLQLDKSEKLFVSVLNRLLGSGVEQDDLKVIHISLKLARVLQLKAEQERAEMGYTWCLEQIEHQKNKSIEAKILYGVIQDWYAQFLLDKGETNKSLEHLKEAHKICMETLGEVSEERMLLLNDLGITCWRAGDLATAEQFLNESIAVGKQLDDKMHLGSVHANLGLIYLQKGITAEANKYCKEAWHIAKKSEDNEGVEQANYCFDLIKTVLENQKTK